MQTDLKEQLEEQQEVLKASLSELKKIKAQIVLNAEVEGNDTIEEEEDDADEYNGVMEQVEDIVP